MYKTMNKLSKPLALVLALVMVLGVTIPALAEEGDSQSADPTLTVKIEQTDEQKEENEATITVTQTKAKDDEGEEIDFQDVTLGILTTEKDPEEPGTEESGTEEPGTEETEAPVLGDVTLTNDADGNLVLTVKASDNEGLATLEVDHSLENILPEFTVGTEAEANERYGASSTFVDGTWTLNFGKQASNIIREKTNSMTFYFVITDVNGNQFGNMDPTTPENTRTFEVPAAPEKPEEPGNGDSVGESEDSGDEEYANNLSAELELQYEDSTTIKEAENQLKAFIDKAKAVKIVKVSKEEGKEIPTDQKWTTEEEQQAFNIALDKALATKEISLSGLDKESKDLSDAISNYEEAKKDGLLHIVKITSDKFDDEGKYEETISTPVPSIKDQLITVTASIKDSDNNAIAEGKDTLTITADKNIILNLEEVIQNAEAAKEGIKVSEDGKDVPTTERWTTQEALDALEAAIKEAKKAKDDENLTEEASNTLKAAIDAYKEEIKAGLTSQDVLDAKAALGTAIENAEAAKEDVKVSEDGSDVAQGDKWTTPKDLKILEDGIAKAKEVLAKDGLDAEEIEANTEHLNSIKELFDLAINKGHTPKEVVDAKSKLKETIEKAINAKVAVSEDGSDVLTTDEWTSAEDLAEFEKAIEIAKEALGNKALDKDALDKNTKYLETAITLYHIAQDNGTLTPAVVDRITGEDIYASSVEVAKAMYPEGAEKVIIATANKEKLADALTAGSLANLYNAPVLLVEGDNVSEVVAEYLADGVKEVTVIGGPNTISPAVFEKLEAMVDSVERIEGSNRFQTAVEVAKLVQKDEAQNKFIVANGEGNEKFVDALSASAVSSVYGYPVLVTSADELVKEATAFLTDSKASEVFVIGGESSIKKAVITDLEKVLDKEATVGRISGLNRNETAVAVAKAFFPEAEQAVFVNGDDNQLVLVAGTYAGSQNAPVILVGQKDVPKPAKEYLPTSAIKDGTVIGSVESVEEIVRLQLEELVK